MDGLKSDAPAFDSSELKELKQKLVDGLGFSSTPFRRGSPVWASRPEPNSRSATRKSRFHVQSPG